MTANTITCLACGVFRAEMEALARQGQLDLTLHLLESMLHMKPVQLEQELERAMAAGPDHRFLLLYGDCHPHMHEMQARNNVSKVAGINCCEILLGREAYRHLRQEQAFIFLPEWTLRWHEVFVHGLGFNKPEVARAFMHEYRKRLVYVDTGVLPVPEGTLQEISAYFAMPVTVLPASLATLAQGIHRALRKFSEQGHDARD